MRIDASNIFVPVIDANKEEETSLFSTPGGVASSSMTFVEKIRMIRNRSELRDEARKWSNDQYRDIPIHILQYAVVTLIQTIKMDDPLYNDIMKLSSTMKSKDSFVNPSGATSIKVNRLPSIILSSVFSFLHPTTTLLRHCTLVCRHWFTVVPLPSSCTVWTDDDKSLYHHIHYVAPLWLSHVEHVSFTRSHFLFHNPRLHVCLRAMRSNKRLRTLTIKPISSKKMHGYNTGIPPALVTNIQELPHLTRLIISSVTQFEGSLLNHSCLRHVEITDIRSVSSSMLVVPSQLQYLKLSAGRSIGCVLDLSNATQLHSLSLTGRWVIVTHTPSHDGSGDNGGSRRSGASESLNRLEYLLEPSAFESKGDQDKEAQVAFKKALKHWRMINHIRIQGVFIDESPVSVSLWQYADLIHCRVLPHVIPFPSAW
jgi:hypothetical protein